MCHCAECLPVKSFPQSLQGGREKRIWWADADWLGSYQGATAADPSNQLGLKLLEWRQSEVVTLPDDWEFCTAVAIKGGDCTAVQENVRNKAHKFSGCLGGVVRSAGPSVIKPTICNNAQSRPPFNSPSPSYQPLTTSVLVFPDFVSSSSLHHATVVRSCRKYPREGIIELLCRLG